MGEARKNARRLTLDRKVRLQFQGTKVTSDAGSLVYREPDEALGLNSAIGSELRDSRTGKNTQHTVSPLCSGSRYAADLQVTTIRMMLSVWPLIPPCGMLSAAEPWNVPPPLRV